MLSVDTCLRLHSLLETPLRVVISIRGSPLYAVQPGEETGESIRTGTIADCVFDEYEWHAVAAYHLDDQTHGQLPGPAGTEVEQNAFVFKNG